MRTASMIIAAGALLGAASSANALVYQFTASLDAGNELHASTSTATGIATLFLDDAGTVDASDDTYDFALSVFDLESDASAWHIHGAANSAENGPVRVGLDGAPFVSFNMGGVLLTGGSNVAAPAIPATPATSTNQGYAAMSFIDMLTNGLAYVNVHTAANPAGAVRGQLTLVTAVPEPSTWALLAGGLGLIGWRARQRQT